jgi:polysaccharide biosynthesis transport protein
MAEISEDQQSERLDLGNLVGIARRRHLQFLIPFFLGWLIVWGASWVLPPRYKSTTTILVEQPTMPKNYVLPNFNDDLQVRLRSITTQILSRTRLLLIIGRLHLYSGMQNPATADERIAHMRKDIDVELVRDPTRQDVSAFKVSYSAGDAHIAQRVTWELTNLFISENQKVLQQESEGTTSFLEKQLQDASANLAAQEAKVDQFEAQHEGALPTQQASNLQILAGLQSQLQNEQDALNTAKQQRVYLQALMEQERAAQAAGRPGLGPGGLAGPTDLATVDQELDTLRDKLAELSSRYTDRYPDVLRLKDQIAKTEAMRERLVAAARKKAADPKDEDAADPTLDPAVRQLAGQLQANQLEITNRESAIAGLKSRINDYQGRLNAEPGTEQQLADLTRGYDQSKKNYDDLLQKRDQSEMATSMEQTQQGERFSMIDPPSLPAKPDFPNRLKFCGFGLAAGLALGFVVAGGFEFMDDRMYSEKEIKALLPMTIISEVPEVVTATDKRDAKRKRNLMWAATAFVVIVIISGSVLSYLQS